MERLRRDVLKANLGLPKSGLVIFTWGNASAVDRNAGKIMIKPSGVSYEALTETHIVEGDLSGQVLSDSFRPSSDTVTHLFI